MDLSVFHHVKSPDRDYRMKDRLNGKTGSFACRFLEWSGWYNQDMYQRLLGHYRLYQLHKAKNKADCQLSLPLAYIANYRASHPIKYLISCITAILYYVFTLGDRYYPLQVEGVNKLLINHRYSILQEFLTGAEANFEEALLNAIQRINEPERVVNQTAVFIQNRHEYKTYNSSSHYFNEYNTTVQSVTNGIKGKEKGVFSKKQILIFFDLLASTGNLERIDFTKPNKFEAVAEMLQAVTGKGKESWIEELKDYKNRGLYEYGDEGELKQLIIITSNFCEIMRKAGFRSLAKTADKHLMELNKMLDIKRSKVAITKV